MLTNSHCPSVLRNNPSINIDDVELIAQFRGAEDCALIAAECGRLYDIYLSDCHRVIRESAERGQNQCLLPVHPLDVIHVSVARDIWETYSFKNEYDASAHAYRDRKSVV